MSYPKLPNDVWFVIMHYSPIMTKINLIATELFYLDLDNDIVQNRVYEFSSKNNNKHWTDENIQTWTHSRCKICGTYVQKENKGSHRRKCKYSRISKYNKCKCSYNCDLSQNNKMMKFFFSIFGYPENIYLRPLLKDYNNPWITCLMSDPFCCKICNNVDTFLKTTIHLIKDHGIQLPTVKSFLVPRQKHPMSSQYPTILQFAGIVILFTLVSEAAIAIFNVF
jgi:endogenous inhibitor of DNA gyrase (YacG/DUF329 family)